MDRCQVMSPLFLQCLMLRIGVKTCIEIGSRMLLYLCCLDLVAIVLLRYLFETIFVCFLRIFYNMAHSRIRAASLLCMIVLDIDFGHNSCPMCI
jgi:hypothetical protein